MLVSLVGLPGSGKSTIGRRLAERLGWRFVDCDDRFERELGVSVRDFFAASGEDAFREHESRILADVLEGRDVVVATGGGAVVREVNRERLRRQTVCVHLKSRLDLLERRLADDAERPLLRGGELGEVLARLDAERRSLYRAVATIEVDTVDRSIDEIVATIDSRTFEARGASATAARSP